MRNTLNLIITTLLACILFITCTAIDGLKIYDVSETPAYEKSSGYPRFAMREDGTLIMTTDGNSLALSEDKGKTWQTIGREPVGAAAKTKVTEKGTTHTLSRANLQPYVLPDGKVLLAYRSHTSGYSSGEFYTSIRVLTSDNGGRFYKGEKILVENTAEDFRGYWEPFFIQIDDDTVAMYYADDLSTVIKVQQQISYFTYTISTGEWNGPFTAIYRKNGMRSRDGMPTVTALHGGGFAMVVEVQDYSDKNSDFNTVFSVGLSLSEDGRTWSDPIPVISPADLKAGIRCSAPSIATLPDGRVIITYQTDDGYHGEYGESDYVRVLGAAISDGALTTETVLTATTGGPAEGFTLIKDLFEYEENQYQIWNTVSCFGNDVYFAGGSGVNTEEGKRVSHKTNIRRAEVTTLLGDVDGDGKLTEKDAKNTIKLIGEDVWDKDVYIADVDASGSVDLIDALLIVKK